MNLDLNTFQPNLDQNWIIKNNIIYYHKYIDIPVLIVKDGVVWISLDFRVKNQIIKMVKHLLKIDVRFFFINRLLTFGKIIYKEDLYLIIKSYLISLTNEIFFDKIFETGFDYIKNILEFVSVYDCHGTLKECIEFVNKTYLKEYKDWFTNKTYYLIKKEYIRDYIKNIERNIKLEMLISPPNPGI